MTELITKTLKRIEDVLSKASNPIALCSFGKDSLTMLYLVRKIKQDIPVILWRENSQFKKYEFAQEIIDKWHLKVYDYPPFKNDILYKNGDIDGVSLYQIGSKYGYKAIQITKPNGHFACAVEDIIMKPTCIQYNWTWDVVIHGHKNADKDSLSGVVGLQEDIIHIDDKTKVFYPLYDWSDADIWNYIHAENIPYNTKRYDVDGKEYEDKAYNENYHLACVKCLNPNEPEMIYCEREKKDVQNIGKLIDYQTRLETYIEPIKEHHIVMEDNYANTLS